MEQNLKNLGVFLATLAMIASVLVVPTASSDSHDLDITGYGDAGLASYASENGTAVFHISIDSLTDIAHNDIAVIADVIGAGGAAGAEITDCADSALVTSIAEEVTLTGCVSLDMKAAEAKIGDIFQVKVDVSSTEDPEGSSITFDAHASNWFVSSADEAKSFNEGDKHTYTITIDNIQVDENGDGVPITDKITVSYASAQLGGWNIAPGSDGSWNPMTLKAEIDSIAAESKYDIELEITLTGGIIGASSYKGDYTIAFDALSQNHQPQQVGLVAQIADNFAVSIKGSGTYEAENGCSTDAETAIWPVTVENFGNTLDSFSVSFNTDNVDWAVTVPVDFTTESLPPKFEDGKHEFDVSMTIPGSVAAGTEQSFTMSAASVADSDVSMTQTFTGRVNQCYGLELVMDEANKTAKANPGNDASFSFHVKNTGNGDDTVSFTCMSCNDAWNPKFSSNTTSLESGKSKPVGFTATVPSGTAAGNDGGTMMLHASSSGCPEAGCEMGDALYPGVTVKASANQVYDIKAAYYSNESGDDQKSATVGEGNSVQMKFTITNNGNGNDQVSFTLVNNPDWVRFPLLEGEPADSALLGPGETKTISVDADSIAGSEGTYTFQVKATSSDGATTSTTGDLTVTVTEASTTSTGPATENVDEDDGGLPGFGALSAIAAIGAVLLLRRRL